MAATIPWTWTWAGTPGSQASPTPAFSGASPSGQADPGVQFSVTSPAARPDPGIQFVMQPVISSAAVGTSGAFLTVTFDRAVTKESADAWSAGFVATGELGAITLVYSTRTSTSNVLFSITRSPTNRIFKDEVVSLAYSPPAVNHIVSAEGYPLGAFQGVAVANNSTVENSGT